MSDILTIPERREAYRQKMANFRGENNAKIEKFVADVLTEVRRHHPDIKMQWMDREEWGATLPWRLPELVFRARFGNKSWYFAIVERDILTADDYDKFFAQNTSLLIALIEDKIKQA